MGLVKIKRATVETGPTNHAIGWPQQKQAPGAGGLAYGLVPPAPVVAAKGAFSHSANYYGFYPGNTPENHPPTKACMIHSKTVQFTRPVFSTSHLSKNMYCKQYNWVPCVKEHMKID